MSVGTPTSIPELCFWIKSHLCLTTGGRPESDNLVPLTHGWHRSVMLNISQYSPNKECSSGVPEFHWSSEFQKFQTPSSNFKAFWRKTVSIRIRSEIAMADDVMTDVEQLSVEEISVKVHSYLNAYELDSYATALDDLEVSWSKLLLRDSGLNFIQWMPNPQWQNLIAVVAFFFSRVLNLPV